MSGVSEMIRPIGEFLSTAFDYYFGSLSFGFLDVKLQGGKEPKNGG